MRKRSSPKTKDSRQTVQSEEGAEEEEVAVTFSMGSFLTSSFEAGGGPVGVSCKKYGEMITR